MGLQASFDILSRIVEQYESNGRSVRQIEVTSKPDEGTLDVTMDVPVTLCSAATDGLSPEFTPEAATLTDGGALRIEFSTSVLDALPRSVTAAVSASNRAVRVTDDSGLLLTVELSIDPTDSECQHVTTSNEHASTVSTAQADDSSTTDESQLHSETADEPEAVRDDSLPLYKDVEYLQRLYDSCTTFTEMNRKIEMDIASETVRRYMIEAGIHTPTTYNVASDEEQADEHRSTEGTTEKTETNTTTPVSARSSPLSDDPMEPAPSEQLVTDGIGLPESLRIEDVIDAVVDSVTVYEVQQRLDLERQRTQQLLKQLNLLDLVMGRIADAPEQEVTYEEVVTRIRHAPSEA